MKQNIFKSIISLVALLLWSTALYAQTTNTAGNWATAANWSTPSSVPINTSGTCSGGSAASSTCTTPVSVGHAMTLNQNLSISTGVYYINANVTDVAGGTAYTLTMSNASYSATQSILDVKSGTTTIEGAVSLSNSTVYVRSGATLITGALTTATASKIVIDAGGTWIVNGNVTDNNTATGLITVNGYLQINGSYTSALTTGGVRVGPSPATTGQMLVTGSITTQNASATIFGSTNNASGTFNSGRALACGASGTAYSTSVTGGYTQSGACNFVTMTFSGTSIASTSWEVSTTGPGSGFSSTGVTTAAYTSSAGQTVNKWYRVAYTVTGCSGSPTLYSYPVLQYVTSGTNTWTGGTSTAWSTASNWSTGVVPDQYSNVVIGTGTYSPTITSTVSVKDLTVNASATLTIGANGTITTDCGSIVNNGTITSSDETSTVKIKGGTQTISGSSTTGFQNLVINNSAVSANSNVNILVDGELKLEGTSTLDFDGSSNTSVFTLKSTSDSPDNTARVAEIPSTSSVSGNITVERYIGAAAPHNVYATPSVVSPTIAMYQDDIPVTGSFTGASTVFLSTGTTTNSCGGTMNTGSAFKRWNSTTGAWNNVPPTGTSNTQTVTNGLGYTYYLWDCIAQTIDLTGNLAVGDINLPIVKTTGIGYEGWNLIGNPYASFIDWSEPSGWSNKAATSDIVWIPYNPFGTNGVIHKVYNGNTGIGVNGGSPYIAPGQAFWVIAPEAASAGTQNLVVKEAAKVGNPNDGQFYGRTSAEEDVLRVRLYKVSDPTLYSDEVAVQFLPTATTGYDELFDVVQLDFRSNTNQVPFGAGISVASYDYAIHAFPTANVANQAVSLNVYGTTSTSYGLEFTVGSFDDNVGIKITDNINSNVQYLTNNDSDYTYTASASNSTPRFTINFVTTHTVTGHASANVAIGDSYIIYGTGFSTTLGNQTVGFYNGSTYTNGTITAATSTQLTVTVPSGAVSGAVKVTKDGFVKTSPVSVVITQPLTVYYNYDASSSNTSKIYYRKNAGSWTLGATVSSTTCNNFTAPATAGDVFEFAVETTTGTEPVQYLADDVNNCIVAIYAATLHGGGQSKTCPSLTRYSYTMVANVTNSVGLLLTTSSGNPVTCLTLTINSKTQYTPTVNGTIYYKVNGGSWNTLDASLSTTCENFVINGLTTGDVVYLSVERDSPNDAAQFKVDTTSGGTCVTTGTAYGAHRTDDKDDCGNGVYSFTMGTTSTQLSVYINNNSNGTFKSCK